MGEGDKKSRVSFQKEKFAGLRQKYKNTSRLAFFSETLKVK